MSDHLVKPVLKRADSVKQIGNAVLESPITTYAAERLDGALTAGDKFVDKYLVPIDGDQTDGKFFFLIFVYYSFEIRKKYMYISLVLRLSIILKNIFSSYERKKYDKK